MFISVVIFDSFAVYELQNYKNPTRKDTKIHSKDNARNKIYPNVNGKK